MKGFQSRCLLRRGNPRHHVTTCSCAAREVSSELDAVSHTAHLTICQVSPKSAPLNLLQRRSLWPDLTGNALWALRLRTPIMPAPAALPVHNRGHTTPLCTL